MHEAIMNILGFFALAIVIKLVADFIMKRSLLKKYFEENNDEEML